LLESGAGAALSAAGLAGGDLAFSAASIYRRRYTMPYVHRLRRLVRGSYASSRFYVKRKRPAGASVFGIPRYHQLAAREAAAV
jgi:hypothetical protein